MEKQQTAVEWVVQQLTPSVSLQQKHIDEILEKAKEMEKELMVEFAQEVFRNRYSGIYESLKNIADDLYNETFKND